MGRKQKEKVGVYDRLGEEVNLDKCPDCLEHTDCFSCLEGKCTALNVSGGQGCPFYKPAEKGIEDCRSAYHRLKKARRYDLIEKYIKAYVAMGFLDDEIEQIEQTEATGSDELTGPDEADDFSKLTAQVPDHN